MKEKPTVKFIGKDKCVVRITYPHSEYMHDGERMFLNKIFFDIMITWGEGLRKLSGKEYDMYCFSENITSIIIYNTKNIPSNEFKKDMINIAKANIEYGKGIDIGYNLEFPDENYRVY